MIPPLRAIRAVINLHRRQLHGLVEVAGAGKMRGHYAQAQAQLQDGLRRMVARGRGDTFGAAHMRMVLLQVRDAARGVQGSIGDVLDKEGRRAAQLAPHHVLGAAEALNLGFGGTAPLVNPAQAAVFQSVYPQVWPSLLDRYEQSKLLYGAPVVRAVKDELTLGLLRKAPMDEVVDRVAGTDGIFAGQRWRAERIVRTELSWGYGVAKQRGMEVLREKFEPRLMKRLVATFDDRTGEDSKELNGQTVPIDQPFVWHVKNSKGVVVKTVLYMQPPNRPQDREIVIPWRAGWPDPGRGMSGRL